MRDRVTDDLTRLIQHGRDREAAELGATQLRETRGAAMDAIAQLDEVIPLLDRLVANLEEGDLTRPTACDEFDVRGVLAHMIGGGTMFAAAFRGEQPGTVPPSAEVLAAFPPTLDALLDAVKSPGALARTIEAPFGPVSGDTFARFVALDGLVHGWDIATATGQSYEPSGELVAAVDAFARSAVDNLRDGVTFAPATTPPPGATPIQHLIAFTGRTVA